VHLVLGAAADEDVVAALADHLVEAFAADEDVVAGDRIERQRVGLGKRAGVAGGAVLRALLDPVVAFVAFLRKVVAGALPEQGGKPVEDDIVAGAGEVLADVIGGDEEFLAGTAEEEIGDIHRKHGMAFDDDVIAVAAVEHVGAAAAGDDV